MALPVTDTKLVLAAQRGESEAWTPLVDQWLPTVLGWCTRLGGPAVDPEDAAQDVFIVAMGRIHSLRKPDRFGSWMVGITRRVLSKHRRRGWVKRWVPGLEIDAPDLSGRGRWPELSETMLAPVFRGQNKPCSCARMHRSQSLLQHSSALRFPIGSEAVPT